MKVRPHPFVVFRISSFIMQSFHGPRTVSRSKHSRVFRAVLAIPFLISQISLAQSGTSYDSKSNLEQTLQQHYDAARTYQISGDNQHASTEYETFLSLALRQCARARAVSDDLSEANGLFNQAIKLTPSDNDLLLSYAYFQLQQQKLSEADELARKIVENAPENPAGLALAGNVAFL